ncbi:hypothetical protein F4781DRAFT_246275 [Annulohypoxylon bovei var. microspora]|nr:hypothetical protein F4781DRAFT_246275 [Annulohypoxylon bovei var. microspora]
MNMFVVRHLACLLGCLPIAFLDRSSDFKAIAVSCVIVVLRTFPITPTRAVFICTLSYVLCAVLYHLQGGLPQSTGANDIYYVLMTLWLGNLEEPSEEYAQTEAPNSSITEFLLQKRSLEKTMLALLDYFCALFITGNSLVAGRNLGVCCFIFLWYWILESSLILYRQWWSGTFHGRRISEYTH